MTPSWTPRYQALFRTYLDGRDEISAWWEITEPLCRRAGVPFRGKVSTEYDDRVDSAYCVGYEPEERKRLVDAYMRDFYGVYGQYPRTIGSWVLDSVTLGYAAERYGVLGGAICRDQMGTDGFTLWGGFPNGIYYPCRKNEFIPAQTLEEQLPTPMFRLLGPDPIYNFEQDVRPGLQGVYTLEPSWLTGRDPKWLAWFFGASVKSRAWGSPYAHVGQENNFLWENIRPGLGPQLALLRELADRGSRPGGDHGGLCRLVPEPVCPDSAHELPGLPRLGHGPGAVCPVVCQQLLPGGLPGRGGTSADSGSVLYREDYPSRYYDRAMEGSGSVMDAPAGALPPGMGERPGPSSGSGLRGPGAGGKGWRMLLWMIGLPGRSWAGETRVAAFTMEPHAITLEGSCTPGIRPPAGASPGGGPGGGVLEHRGFFYGFRVARGGSGRLDPKVWKLSRRRDRGPDSG